MILSPIFLFVVLIWQQCASVKEVAAADWALQFLPCCCCCIQLISWLDSLLDGRLRPPSSVAPPTSRGHHVYREQVVCWAAAVQGPGLTTSDADNTQHALCSVVSTACCRARQDGSERERERTSNSWMVRLWYGTPAALCVCVCVSVCLCVCVCECMCVRWSCPLLKKSLYE